MSSRTFNDPQSDAARQALLDNRCEHKPKRHRTLARRKRMAKAKRQRIKLRLEMKIVARRKHVAKVRAYWQNEGDHP